MKTLTDIKLKWIQRHEKKLNHGKNVKEFISKTKYYVIFLGFSKTIIFCKKYIIDNFWLHAWDFIFYLLNVFLIQFTKTS